MGGAFSLFAIGLNQLPSKKLPSFSKRGGSALLKRGDNLVCGRVALAWVLLGC